VTLAIGIAGDVTNLERIVLGRYERTELLPIRLGQQIKTTPPSAPAPSRKCAKGSFRQAAAFAPTTPSPARAMIAAALRWRIASRASAPISASSNAFRVQSTLNALPSVPHTIRYSRTAASIARGPKELQSTYTVAARRNRAEGSSSSGVSSRQR